MAAVVAALHTHSERNLNKAGTARSLSASFRVRSGDAQKRQEYTPELKAATLIGRAWRRLRRGAQLDRKNFVERLLLEDAVCVGVARLVLFVVMFAILLTVTSLGPQSIQRRANEIVLSNALNLQSFDEIARLEDFRGGLQEFSANIKQFSASGSQRFPDEDAVIVVGSQTSFSKAKVLTSRDLKVAALEFTMTAWVRAEDESLYARPLLRKPLRTNPDVSCWGWFYPSSFQFGAHDYHSTTMDAEANWQDEVRADALPERNFNHEAIVVQNNSVLFYRNGVVLNAGGYPLQRPITDCDGTSEVGSPGLQLSSVKFYPRALTPAEITEINVNGQPLSEIATGSLLSGHSDNVHDELMVGVDGIKVFTESSLLQQEGKMELADQIARAKLSETEESLDGSLFPVDPSPPATLLPDEPQSYLPPLELQSWQGGGSKRDLSAVVVDRWQSGLGPAASPQSSAGPSEAYWSVIEEPVYAHAAPAQSFDPRGASADTPPLATLNMSGVPPDAEVITFSYWIKPVQPKLRFSQVLRVGGLGQLDVLSYHMMSFGGAASRLSDGGGGSWAQRTADIITANQVTGPLDEKFFITAFNHGPTPTVWRHVACLFFLKERRHTAYLDGRLIAEVAWPPELIGEIPMSALHGKNISVTTFPWWNGPGKTLSKIAQLRMYPRELSQSEIQAIQNQAEWPDGAKVKECKEQSDNSFQDSPEVDSQGRNCAWYSEQLRASGSNRVCASAAAKALCPLTCRGVRECSTGFPFDGNVNDEATRQQATAAQASKYRIFDRIMHIKPRAIGIPTVICPRKSLDVAAEVARCRAQRSTYADLPNFRETWLSSLSESWSGYQRADVSDCDVLEQRLDAYQCAWDDGWISDFQRDFAQHKAMSINFWVHSTPSSQGMPTQFVSALNALGTLVPPRTLFDVREQNPTQEAITRFAVPYTDGQNWGSIRHRNSIDFVNEWTFYYLSLRELPSGDWQQCLAVNGFPLDCNVQGAFGAIPGFLPFPDDFLTAFELTNEVLISPIEFSTEVLRTPEVQGRYYRNAPKMQQLLGPSSPERQRLLTLSTPAEKSTNAFAETILLAAPPFLYQVRSKTGACKSEAMQIFLSKQLDLIQGTQWQSEQAFQAPPDVFACKGDEAITQGRYYGLEASRLQNDDVYADFLYSIADNEILVRDGEILKAVEFVDRGTDRANILCLFHTPRTGDTTVLDVIMTADGSRIAVSTQFQHIGFLDAGQRETALVLWTIFFVLAAITAVFNVVLFINLFRERRQFPDVGWDWEALGEVVYDWIQVTVLVTYGAVKYAMQLRSEENAKQLVTDFVKVPFRDSSETVQNKIDAFFSAVETMRGLLGQEKSLQNAGFFIMILMLVRIINATAVHPRTGVLIGTIRAGMNDIWHFFILFMLIFCFSSLVANWSFGTRPEFETIHAAMRTQFEVLLGSLPEGFTEDPLLVIYVALTNIVQFFLMLNFLLAIVVESYMKVRDAIEELQTENEVLTDLFLTLQNGALGLLQGWPQRRRTAVLLKHRLARRNVTKIDLHVLGLPIKSAQKLFKQYHGSMDILQARPWAPEVDVERVGEVAEKARESAAAAVKEVQHVQQQLHTLQRGLETVMAKLGCAVPASKDEAPLRPPRAHIEMSSLLPHWDIQGSAELKESEPKVPKSEPGNHVPGYVSGWM